MMTSSHCEHVKCSLTVTWTHSEYPHNVRHWVDFHFTFCSFFVCANHSAHCHKSFWFKLVTYNDEAMGWNTAVQFSVGARIFLLVIACRLVVLSIQPVFQWVTGRLSPEVKQPRHATRDSLPSSTDVENVWSCTSILNMSSCHGS